jgi:uncharacterized phage protein (TIGR01671 family)
MREREYRAWDEENECMTYSNVETEDYAWGFEDGKMVVYFMFDQPATLEEPAYPDMEEVSGPITEFTGLYDKHGKPYFEGDVFEYRIFPENKPHYMQRCVVVWDNERACYRADALNGDCKGTWIMPVWEHNEIIGNIYENPNLLEDKS